MNEETRDEGKAIQVRESSPFSLTPTNLDEAWRFAKILSSSELVPKDFRGKPENTLVAVQMGMEIGLPPIQALQNIAVINGKPGVYGDMGKALLQRAGLEIQEDDIEDIAKNEIARCTIIRPGWNKPVTRSYSVQNAKDAKLWGKGGPWTTDKWRQMAWRAFWFAARDIASDILKGLAGAEELFDMPKDMGAADVVDRGIGAESLAKKLEADKKPEPTKQAEKAPAEKPKATKKEDDIIDAEFTEEKKKPDDKWVESYEKEATKPTEAAPEETAEAEKVPIKENKQKVIRSMMARSGVTEEQLFSELGITSFDDISENDTSLINKCLTLAKGSKRGGAAGSSSGS